MGKIVLAAEVVACILEYVCSTTCRPRWYGVRRAKLYYLRDKVGKAARIPEKR